MCGLPRPSDLGALGQSERVKGGSIMVDSALFVGWAGTYPGREVHARKTFTEFVEALTNLQMKGEIERFEPVLLGSEVGIEGFVLVYGEYEKLMLMLHQELFERLRIKAMLDHAKLFIVPAIVGDRVPETMLLFEEFAKELEREPVIA